MTVAVATVGCAGGGITGRPAGQRLLMDDRGSGYRRRRRGADRRSRAGV